MKTNTKVYIVWAEDKPVFINFEEIGENRIIYFTYEALKKVVDNWDALLRKETVVI